MNHIKISQAFLICFVVLGCRTASNIPESIGTPSQHHEFRLLSRQSQKIIVGGGVVPRTASISLIGGETCEVRASFNDEIKTVLLHSGETVSISGRFQEIAVQAEAMDIHGIYSQRAVGAATPAIK